MPATLTALPADDDEAAASLRGKRLGLPREYFVAGMEPGVEARVREAVAALEAAGATVEDVSLPHTDYGLATYYIVAPAEASANLARYDGIRYGPRLGEGDVLANYLATRGRGFGAEVKRRIMLGTYALSAGYYDAYYLKAQKVRTLIKGDFDALWAQGFDALVAPTSPTVAFRFGARLADPVSMYLSDACTLPVNMAGLPGRVGPVRPVGRAAGRAPAHRRGVVRGGAVRPRRAATRRSPPTRRGARLEPADLAAAGRSRRADARRADGGRSRRRERRPDGDRHELARPARRPRARGARPGRAAVGHPPVLRHRRDDGRRHQPRRRRARLRHARGSSSRRASRACARAGPTTPATSARSSCGGRSSRHLERALRRRLRPGDRDPGHGRGVGGASTWRCARRATRVTRSSSTSRRTWRTSRPSSSPAASVRHVATRFEDDFALDPAAVEAAITPRTKALFLGYPCNPTGAVLPDDVAGRARGHRRPPRPPRLQRRDLRPARLRRPTATGRSARCPACASGRS